MPALCLQQLPNLIVSIVGTRAGRLVVRVAVFANQAAKRSACQVVDQRMWAAMGTGDPNRKATTGIMFDLFNAAIKANFPNQAVVLVVFAYSGDRDRSFR